MSGRVQELVVVDKPGASSGCACGGAVDPDLPRFAGDLEWVRGLGVTVRRLDPARHLQALADYPPLQVRLSVERFTRLPLVLIDGRVVHNGSYPSRRQLVAMLDVSMGEAREA
jgi:hypothetical protein